MKKQTLEDNHSSKMQTQLIWETVKDALKLRESIILAYIVEEK